MLAFFRTAAGLPPGREPGRAGGGARPAEDTHAVGASQSAALPLPNDPCSIAILVLTDGVGCSGNARGVWGTPEIPDETSKPGDCSGIGAHLLKW